MKCTLFASIYFKYCRGSARLWLWLQRKPRCSVLFQSSSRLHFVTAGATDVSEVSLLPLNPRLRRGS